MRHIAERFGFSAFAISQYVTREGLEQVDLLLNGLPEGFDQRFITLNYGVTNPISRRARQSDEAFFWHDVTYDKSANPEGHEVMEDAARVGLTDGYCVPVRLPEGGRGLVSFLGGHVPLEDQDRLALQAVMLSLSAALIAAILGAVLAPLFPLDAAIPTSAYLLLPVITVVVGLLACSIALRRASRVDPATAFGG